MILKYGESNATSGHQSHLGPTVTSLVVVSVAYALFLHCQTHIIKHMSTGIIHI